MEEKFRNKDNAGSFKRDFQFAVVKIKTAVITLVNHNRHRQFDELIGIRNRKSGFQLIVESNFGIALVFLFLHSTVCDWLKISRHFLI